MTMALSDNFETTEEFLKELRGVWQFYCSSAENFAGFVYGFFVGRSLDADSYWSDFPEYVVQQDLPLPGAPWLLRIKSASPSEECEVPLIYKLFDKRFDVSYPTAWACETTEEWKEWFLADHTRLRDPYDTRILPIPDKLVYVLGDRGFWRLFYINEEYSRYYEANFRSQEKLVDWAESCLKIPVYWWKQESLGGFR